jgi:arylformamidase
MKAIIQLEGVSFSVDLSQGLDISIPLKPGVDTVNAFYIPPVQVEPFRIGNFVGSVNEGGSCNVNTITFNPHGNGTHTECVGHISREGHLLKDCLKESFFPAKLISVKPSVSDNGDKCITPGDLSGLLEGPNVKALIVRTLPNDPTKTSFHYSGTNPVYIRKDAMELIVSSGIEHLLIDLPSVDREEDGGALASHHIFWNYPGTEIRYSSTITELVYVPDEAADGFYLLNLQVPGVWNDAAPSKPVLYRLDKTE